SYRTGRRPQTRTVAVISASRLLLAAAVLCRGVSAHVCARSPDAGRSRAGSPCQRPSCAVHGRADSAQSDVPVRWLWPLSARKWLQQLALVASRPWPVPLSDPPNAAGGGWPSPVSAQPPVRHLRPDAGLRVRDMPSGDWDRLSTLA